MGLWTGILPEVGTNLILNPSGELSGNFGAHNGATVTIVTTHARYGIRCYSIVTGATNRGMTLTVGALANAIHYLTFYARKDSTALTGTLQVSANAGTNYNNATIISGLLADSNSRWIRYGVSIPAAQANGSTSIIIRNTVNENFYIDAAMIQQLNYATTYIDGDRTGLYRWNGLRNASTSTRDAQERGGGRERDLADDLGIIVDPVTKGYGYPPIKLNFFPQPLQPGSLFQSDKLDMRELLLNVNINPVSTGTPASYQQLMQKRKAFLALMRSNQYRGRQPFIMGTTVGGNTGKPVYGAFRMADGMRGNGQTGFTENATIRLISEQPYLYEDSNDVTALTLQQSVTTAARGVAKINGLWQGLGSGFNGIVFAVAYDLNRNRVYFGGDFTTANGVTVNGICYWDGRLGTFVAMGSGVAGGASERVRAIAIAPNGDVWIGGAFTTVNGVASNNNIARWNLSSSTWTAFGTIGTGLVYAIAIHPVTGLVYVGGGFTNWNADANADYIVTYNGSTWAAMGTGGNNAVRAFVFDNSFNLYIAGAFTTLNGVSAAAIAKWDGTVFTALGAGLTGGGSPSSLTIAYTNGILFAGGVFTTAGGISAANIAYWNGSQWYALTTGTNNTVTKILPLSTGLVLVGGAFTVAGGLSLTDRIAYWNGTGWLQTDINLPGSPFVYGAIETDDGDIYLGCDTSGTATALAQTTVTNPSSTSAFPVCYLIGPTTGSLTFQWLENQSTGDRIYFNLPVQAGETVEIDLRPYSRQITSDWRGPINTQPLGGSDFTSFDLLPGANVIAAFATGTLTGAELRMHVQPIHDSGDGVA